MSAASAGASGRLAQIQQIVAEIRSDSWVEALLRGTVAKLLPNIGEGATPSALSQLGSLDPRIAQMVRPLNQPIDALSHDNRALTSVVSGPLRTIGGFTSALEQDLDTSQRKLASLWKGGAAATAVQQHMADLSTQLSASSLATAGLAAAVDRGGLVVAAARQIAVAVAQAAGAAALTWIRTQALGLLAQGVSGINQIIQHIAGGLQQAARRITDIATAGIRSLGQLKSLIGRLKQAVLGQGGGSGPGHQPDGPGPHTKVVGAETITHYDATHEGPLAEKIAKTFRGGSYDQVVSTQPTKLYRAYGGSARRFGAYWSQAPIVAEGALSFQIRAAVLPEWGNKFTDWVEVTIPPGTEMYRGPAAPQNGLVGGLQQIFLPTRATDEWVTGHGKL